VDTQELKTYIGVQMTKTFTRSINWC